MLVLVLSVLAVASAGPLDQTARPYLKQYCVTCHSARLKTAGVVLDGSPSAATWEKVVRKLRAGEMPPPGLPRAPESVSAKLVESLTVELDSAALAHPDPGRVPPHRLNRAEYNNAVRDLFGIDFHPADSFPADDAGYGFDNIAGALSLPPVLMEKYLAAAGHVSRAAMANGRVLTCRPAEAGAEETCASEILSKVARRAWRRPVTPSETANLMRFYRMGRSDSGKFEGGVELGLKAILVSPRFLFRAEHDPATIVPGAVYALDDWDLAARLSFFLWGSLPDEPLLALAERGELGKPEIFDAQVRRMLADGRARALTGNFAGQWLHLRNLAGIKPDPEAFPAFSETLRQAMLREAEMFFESVVREDHSVLDFIDAPYTFLNGALANFYGIPGVEGRQFRKVTLPDSRRGGVLTMAAVLAVTSYPTRTSPVVRGKWILENVLGAPPPPPPPNIPPLPPAAPGQAVSLRKQMERHRADASCAVCHVKMDPLGFALENYDGIGRWRERDGGYEIDASGKLPSGAFHDATELKKMLRAQPQEFLLCFTEKLMTYAVGRGMEQSDKPVIRAIVRDAARDDYRFSSLVLGVARSAPFRMRRAEGKEASHAGE